MNQHDYETCPDCGALRRYRRRDAYGNLVGGECMCGTQLISCANELIAQMESLQQQRPSWGTWMLGEQAAVS